MNCYVIVAAVSLLPLNLVAAEENTAGDSWSGAHYEKNSTVQRKKVDNLVNHIKKTYVVDTPLRILDLGCGSGVAIQLLAEHFPNATIIGGDISENMLLEAQRLRGHLNNVSFEIMNGENLPEKYVNMFDVVIMSSVIHWIADHEKVIQGLGVIIKPSGKVFIDTAVKDPQEDKAPFWQAVLKTAQSKKWRAVISIEELIKSQEKIHRVDLDMIENYFNQAGFCEVTIIDKKRLRTEYNTPQEFEGWLHGFVGAYLGDTVLADLELRKQFMHDAVKNYLKLVPLENDKLVYISPLAAVIVATK